MVGLGRLESGLRCCVVEVDGVFEKTDIRAIFISEKHFHETVVYFLEIV